MKKAMLGALVLIILVFSAASVIVAQDATPEVTQEPAAVTQVQFQPMNNSGVTGFVLLQPQTEGTFINVIVFGLQQDGEYVSLYYTNHTCELEEDSFEKDKAGNIYVGNRVGVGVTEGTVDDALDEINSVSVRVASNDELTLLACADIHPGA